MSDVLEKESIFLDWVADLMDIKERNISVNSSWFSKMSIFNAAKCFL